MAVANYIRCSASRVAAVATLIIGVAESVSVLVVVQATLFPRLPVSRQGELFEIRIRTKSTPALSRGTGVRAPILAAWRERVRSVSQFAMYELVNPILDGVDGPQRVAGVNVEPGLMSTLGSSPLQGLAFSADGSCGGYRPAVLVSHAFWQLRMGARPDAVGTTIRLDGTPHYVCGIMPSAFHFPLVQEGPMDAVTWRSFTTADAARVQKGRRKPFEKSYEVVARIAPGVPADDARAELAVVAREGGYLDASAAVVMVPLGEAVTRAFRRPLILTLALALLLQVLSVASVAALILMDSASRRTNSAIRGALGATSGRLFWETWRLHAVWIGLAGTTGIALASLLVSTVEDLAPEVLPPLVVLQLNGTVVAIGLAMSGLLGISLAMIPAADIVRHTSGTGLLGRREGRSAPGVPGRVFLIMAGVQLALAVCLVFGATLAGRSVQRLLKTDRGFDATGIAVCGVELPQSLESAPAGLVVQRLISSGSRLPGVDNVAVATGGPFFGLHRARALLRTGSWEATIDGVQVYAVTSDYFATLRIQGSRSGARSHPDRIPAGGAFIDEEMARLLPAGVDPTTGMVVIGGDETYRVAGVVGGTRDLGSGDHSRSAPICFLRGD